MQSVVNAKRFVRAAVAGCALAATPALLAAQPAAAPPETGLWIDDTGKGAVRIESCPEPGKLCGRIFWLQEPMNAEGQPKFDRFNPRPEMRARPICGLPVLGNLAPVAEGGYDGGWVYDPKVGKSYDVAIVLTAPDVLQVTGYKGMKLLGKSFNWTRAKTDLPGCDGSTAATAPQPASPAPAKTAKKASKPAAAIDVEVLPWQDKGAPAGR